VANLSTTPETCAGSCDGTATVGPTGGAGQYTYVWDPVPPVGQGTAQASGLCPGAWEVVVTDSIGCSIIVPVLILGPQPLAVQGTISPITCNSSCDGAIDVVVQGGVGLYTFNWTPQPPVGQGTPSISVLCAGDWTVTVTDANGCDTTVTFTLVDPPVLDASVAVVDNLCFGDCLGTATATITGGVPPYTIVWATDLGTQLAQDTLAVEGLCAGGHTLTVTDANGCTFTVPFNVGQGAPIDAGLVFTNETCDGPCDGTATVNPTGGAGGFSFLWTPVPPVGQGTPQASGLCPGNWSVTITDANGCDTTVTFTLLPFTPIAPNAVVSNVQCNGACDGSVQLAPTGGFGNYTYLWSPVPPSGQGNASATGLCPGNWSVTIADAIGCDTTVSFTITEPDTITITVDQVVDASCANAADGAINITIAGGVPGYTVQWTGPGFTSANEDIAGLAPGLYTVVVLDANGCSVSLPITVNALITVVADAGADQTLCAQEAIVLDGSASQGGTSTAWANWNGQVIGTTPVLNVGTLPPGTYVFTYTVSDGPCSDVDSVTVNVLQLPLANAGPDLTIIGSGQVQLGGAPSGPSGSAFAWQPDSLLSDPAAANPTTAPASTTWFTLTVVGPNGCVDTDSALVTVVPEVVIPSGFSPNGDGWNDTWQIDLIDQFPACEVEVYNRWGELLFRSVGYQQPWDGRYDGGLVPVGTYYYIVKLNDPKFPDAYTGPLTVVR
jgi:gliding motility-associated-like protein